VASGFSMWRNSLVCHRILKKLGFFSTQDGVPLGMPNRAARCWLNDLNAVRASDGLPTSIVPDVVDLANPISRATTEN